MSERLVRVERFEDLAALDYIELRPCRTCGGRHRALLIAFDPWSDAIDELGQIEPEPC